MDFLNIYNLTLWFTVIVFWGTAMLLARANRIAISPRLAIIPTVFIIAGLAINRYHFPWGTYAVAMIHVMMLPALLKVAKNRP